LRLTQIAVTLPMMAVNFVKMMRRMMMTQMALIDLHIMSENDELPTDIAFKIVGGKTIYKHIGWMWRKSDKQIYLNKYDWDFKNEERHRRYLDDSTIIEVLQLSEVSV
jgi:hypothetical protein